MGLPKILQKILPKKWLYEHTLRSQHKKMLGETSVEDWIANGSVGAAPAPLKWATMKEYVQRYKATWFVETGTFMGDTIFNMKDTFSRLDTIELDEKLAARARQRFENQHNIHVWQGDSGQEIHKILNIMPKNTVALFWLDGHFSGGVTAKADLNTPISAELDDIFKHSKNHIILIDDARLFISQEEDYPSLEELKKQVYLYNPNAIVEVKYDIIRITNK